ncbi:MAG: 3-phosphoshikimate 1-carboxyvinyltransferase [Planctomycetota bacterium]
MNPDEIEIMPQGFVDARIRPPGSKSITNRALVCAALANGRSRLDGVLNSEDTQVMVEAIRQLGMEVHWDREGNRVELAGCGGSIPVRDKELFVANSGTTMRFLTAMLAVCPGRFRLHGVARMHQRPIQDLLDALNALGADTRSENNTGCPPVIIREPRSSGGTATVRGDMSSQFLSGLLLAVPYSQRPVTLHVEGPLVSKPYVSMTLGVMRSFGVSVREHDLSRFQIDAPRVYNARRYTIEPDATAASYFWAAAAITGGRVTVRGLGPNALQGDVHFCDCLEQMGCEVTREAEQITVTGKPLRGISVDMNAMSDTAQTLSAVALFAAGPTTISGVAHNRHKETDRIADLARELRKFGAYVEELPDGLRIEPRRLHGASVSTYRDHRMAMSLALVGLRVEGVVIQDPQCTQKTYPDFFRDLESLRG